MEECKRLFRLAGPICLQNVLTFSTTLVGLAFVGRVGELALSAAVLGSSCYNITGLSVLQGLAAGMETLCGQAYGAEKYQALGVVLQQALLICGLFNVAIMALWSQMQHLLRAAGQPVEIVKGAVSYLLLSIPALWATTVTETLKRYLLAQGVVVPVTVAVGAAAAAAPLYCWLLVFRAGLGLAGAALANSAVQATAAAALALYVAARDRTLRGTPRATWPGWTGECLRGVFAYLALALPSMGATTLEWALYEGLVIIAGWLPEPQVAVAVMGIAFSTTALTYTISAGLAGAASTRVGHEVGGGRPRAARCAAFTALGVETALMSAVAGAGCSAARVWGRLFTDDAPVLDLLSRVLPIVFLSELGDGANAVCGGIMRGIGWQVLALGLNFGVYWGLGLPLAIVAGLIWHWGVLGLWAALATATSIQGLAMAATVCSFDWGKEVGRAAVRKAPPDDGRCSDGEDGGRGDALTAPLLDVVPNPDGEESV